MDRGSVDAAVVTRTSPDPRVPTIPPRGSRPTATACAVFVILLASIAALPRPATAHDVDVTGVARVFLDQLGERRYGLSVVDAQVPPISGEVRVLPDRCGPFIEEEGRLTFECRTPLTFDDVITLPWDLAGVVVVARWSDGSEVSGFFRGEGGVVPVRLAGVRAGANSMGQLAGSYLVLGVEHILFGIDHLLFIVGLLLLIRGGWPLVKTITAFTVAHSITLGAAVLGFVPVSSGPVEAAIALSIVLLAREIVMGYRGRTSLVHRRPWLVAFVFGLLHGLGFAGALGEIGLRGADIPAALLFFNLGVEVGQLAFVAAVMALGWMLARLARRARGARAGSRIGREDERSWSDDLVGSPLAPALGYALGALAMFWFLERLPAVFGA